MIRFFSQVPFGLSCFSFLCLLLFALVSLPMFYNLSPFFICSSLYLLFIHLFLFYILCLIFQFSFILQVHVFASLYTIFLSLLLLFARYIPFVISRLALTSIRKQRVRASFPETDEAHVDTARKNAQSSIPKNGSFYSSVFYSLFVLYPLCSSLFYFLFLFFSLLILFLSSLLFCISVTISLIPDIFCLDKLRGGVGQFAGQLISRITKIMNRFL